MYGGKMRRITFLLAALIFLIACYTLYISLDASMTKRKVLYEKEQKDLEVLEQRVASLQDNIEKNAEIIKEIKKNLNSLSKKSAYSVEKAIFDTSKPKKSESIVKFPEQTCAFAKRKIKNTEIQTLDVYEMLKFDNPDGGVWKQGWNITYDRKSLENEQTPKLKVFVVPHSHCDPGWIKTFDEYYKEQTKHILDGMTEKLDAESRMKFIYAEISFFERWWRDAGEDKRQKVKKLIKNGQFEIVTGAWVMTDEANSHYFATIDQIIEGNQWVYNHLDFIPKNHWSIDPFGLTPTMAHFTKLAGFSSMAVQRVHYSVKKHLAMNKKLEFYWRQLWNENQEQDMFCHVFPFYSYDVPHTCGPEPKICCQFDFRRLPGFGMACPWQVAPSLITEKNVEERAFTLLDQYRKKAQLYKTEVLLVPLGDDFRYDSAQEWDHQFENYQKLFDFMNKKTEWNVEAKFGTLNDYFKSLDDSVSVKKGSAPDVKRSHFPVLSGDFFTYADRDHHYWSGYYTTRPFYKRMDRLLQQHLRAAEILFSLANARAEKQKVDGFKGQILFPMLVNARRNMGLFQHHDGITGTAKDHVMMDYGHKMQQSIKDCRMIIGDCSRYLLDRNSDVYQSVLTPAPFQFVERMSQYDSIPEMTVLTLDKDERIVIIFNPLTIDRNEIVCLQSSHGENIRVKDSFNDKIIPVQINPVIYKDRDRMQISFTVVELCWMASIPALSLKRYVLSSDKEAKDSSARKSTIFTNFGTPVTSDFDVKNFENDVFLVENEYLLATVTSATGFLKAIQLKNQPEVNLNLDFAKYGTSKDQDKSGAYLFLPDGDATELPSSNNKVLLIRGHLLSSVHVVFAQVKHTVKICHFESVACRSLDIQNLVDISREENFELVMRLKTGVKNEDDTFFTDLNGFQIIKRKYFSKIPHQGNVYPMPTAAYLEDKNFRLTLLSGQPNGVVSSNTGHFEVFLDRRLMQDDNRGLFQSITDNKITPNVFKLVFESLNEEEIDNSRKIGHHTLLSHLNSLSLLYPLLIMFNNAENEQSKLDFLPSKRFLSRSLPCDLHLINLRTLQEKQIYNESGDLSASKSSQDYDNFYPNVRSKNELALILHRFSYDCKARNENLAACLNFYEKDNQISLLNLFDGLKFETLQETSLNLLHSKENALTSDFAVKFEPMDIKAFKMKI